MTLLVILKPNLVIFEKDGVGVTVCRMHRAAPYAMLSRGCPISKI
jgi:hypothetical protein